MIVASLARRVSGASVACRANVARKASRANKVSKGDKGDTGAKGDPGEIPTPIIWVHHKTTVPTLAKFPKVSVGDIIERLSDGSRWKVEA